MKKEFWEQYTIGDDDILTDNVTGERVSFFIDPITNEISFVPVEEKNEETRCKDLDSSSKSL